MFKRWFDHFWLHAKTYAIRLWAFLKNAVLHPWDSVVSFFAWIGSLVFRIFGWVWAGRTVDLEQTEGSGPTPL